MTTKSADYCKLVNEWAWKVRRVLIKAGSGLGFSFGVNLDRNGDMVHIS